MTGKQSIFLGRKKKKRNTAIGVALFIHGTVIAFAAIVSFRWLAIGVNQIPDLLIPLAITNALLAFSIVVFWISGVLVRGKARRWHFGIYFSIALLGLIFSFGFYDTVMHDVALIFF